MYPADEIQHDGRPAAVGQAQYLGQDVGCDVVEHLVGAELADPVELVGRAGGGDDRGTGILRDLHRRAADAAGSGVHQHRLPRPERHVGRAEAAVAGQPGTLAGPARGFAARIDARAGVEAGSALSSPPRQLLI